MVEMVIERKPTEDELRNYTPVGFQTIEKKWNKMRVIREQEYVKQHKPYCSRCADLDFFDMWEGKKNELKRKLGTGNLDTTKINFDFPDLEKYGKIERFELKNKSPIIRDVIVDNIRVPKLVGHYYEYVCVERGCGRAVEVPLAGMDLTIEKSTK